MIYDLLLRGRPAPDRLAAALAALAAVPVADVDVAPEGVTERNWSAPVLCTLHERSGDVQFYLDVYLDDPVPVQPSELEAAAMLARYLGDVVLYSAAESQPGAYWLVGPDGGRTRARLEEGDDPDDPRLRVTAVERRVAAWPELPVTAMPEVIREHEMPTPATDKLSRELAPRVDGDGVTAPDATLRSARNRLSGWEALVSRADAGWPPDGWYPADYYREDLERRDALATLVPTFPDDVRVPFEAALAQVDRRYADLTVDDGGAALAAELGEPVTALPDRWWWHRTPRPLPWERQPARPPRPS